MKRTPTKTYPPGYFTESMTRHNWPPRFVSKMDAASTSAHHQRASAKARELAVEHGLGWGTGTIVLPNTPKHQAPGMMERPR
jgi:hypothetical protein